MAVCEADPTSGVAPLTVNFYGANSTDADGTIESYAWDFGDGNTATTATGSNTYAAPGTYTAQLIVTDNEGASDTCTVDITVTEPAANMPPMAVCEADPTSGVAPLTVNFSGANSTDADGTIESYAWDFGDGNTATTATGSNTYAAPGTYTAQLIVTDNEGASDTCTVDITVIEAGDGMDLELSVAASPVDLIQYAPVTITLTVINAGSELATGVKVSAPVPDGFAFTSANAEQGNYSLFFEEWIIGEIAPGASATLELVIFVLDPSSETVYYTQILEASPADVDSAPGNNDGPVPNEDDEAAITLNFVDDGNLAPVAAFSSIPESGLDPLTIQFSGFNSFDADGTIVDYAWDFGDGTTGNGENITHTFAAPGTYLVTLVVTDDDGATGTKTLEVVVNDANGQTVDLELALSADPTTIQQYETVTLTFEVTNTGTAPASTVQVSAPVPDGFAFTSANAVQGNYSLFFETWTIDQIAAGETATLELVIFVLDPVDPFTYYSQILLANPTDVDSTPGNNDGPVPSEDDEAAVTLTLESLLIPTISLQNNSSSDQLDNADIMLFPNPATSELFIDLEVFNGLNASYQITDLLGKTVAENNLGVIENKTLRIDVSNYAAGMYYLNMKIGDKFYRHSFMMIQ